MSPRRLRASDVNPAVLAAAGVSTQSDTLSKSKRMVLRLVEQCIERGLAEPRYFAHPDRELRFAKDLGRQWRFDLAWPDALIAVEVEGLVVMRVDGELVCKGRHASISGFKDDCEKYAWAAVLGWRVLRFEQSQVKSRFAVDMIVRVLAGTTPTKQTACAGRRERARGEGVTAALPFDPF